MPGTYVSQEKEKVYCTGSCENIIICESDDESLDRNDDNRDSDYEMSELLIVSKD